MNLEHQSIVPLYAQIMKNLQNDIEEGIYAPGQKLPTEEEFGEKYNVSRITIRRAITELTNQGIVEKKQGKGTFVRMPRMHKQYNHPGMSFTELCEANGVKAGARILSAGIVVPENPKAVRWLGLHPGETAVQIRRLRYADSRPLVIEDNYFPMKYVFLLGVDLEKGSLYRYLQEEMHIKIVAGELSLRLIRADAKDARLLEVPRGTPMLQTDGCTYDGSGEVLHTCTQIGYGEDFEFIVR